MSDNEQDKFKKMMDRAISDQQEAGITGLAVTVGVFYRELTSHGLPEEYAIKIIRDWFIMMLHKNTYPDDPPDMSGWRD